MKDLQLNYKAYTNDELESLDYEPNFVDRYVADVDLRLKDIKGVLGSPTRNLPKHTDWYLFSDGSIIKLMFVKSDEGTYKTLYISAEQGVNENTLYDLLEFFVNDETED